jgi:hypothetical protein
MEMLDSIADSSYSSSTDGPKKENGQLQRNVGVPPVSLAGGADDVSNRKVIGGGA